MGRRLQVLGRKFGMLTPVEELPPVDKMRRWRLICDCGNERITLQKSFTCGSMRSCGCAKRPSASHGMSGSPEYRHWINMISRCENPNTPEFGNYGGRGIVVCERWRKNFAHFYEDMGAKPGRGYSVDRIDNDGSYEPGNCRWATQEQQCRNTRTNRRVAVDGIDMTLAEAASSAPVTYNTVLYRLKRGWPIYAAISRPPQKGVRP